MVGTALTIEREIKDARSTRDAGVSSKRKESQSSSSLGKKQKASSSRGFQSRDHPGQGQIRVSSQAGQMVCYHCQQPGHMRRNCPQRQGSQGFGTTQSQSAVEQEMIHYIPPDPSTSQRSQYQFQGATWAPPVHRQAREARLWAEAEDEAHKQGHQEFRGVSTPSQHRQSQQINQSYRVRFCYLAYGQECYLILVLCIHSLLHRL